MKKRLKLPALPPITSREEAEVAVNEITGTMLNRRKCEAMRDGHMLEVEQRFAAIFEDYDRFVAQRCAALQAWADAHPDEFPKRRKSLEFATGTIGWRTGTPKLKLLKKLTWDKLLERLQILGLKKYLRQKWEVNKDAMIADREGAEHGLRELGVSVIQEETFYVEPNLTQPEGRLVGSSRCDDREVESRSARRSDPTHPRP